MIKSDIKGEKRNATPCAVTIHTTMKFPSTIQQADISILFKLALAHRMWLMRCMSDRTYFVYYGL